MGLLYGDEVYRKMLNGDIHPDTVYWHGLSPATYAQAVRAYDKKHSIKEDKKMSGEDWENKTYTEDSSTSNYTFYPTPVTYIPATTITYSSCFICSGHGYYRDNNGIWHPCPRGCGQPEVKYTVTNQE